jgi:DHA1 family tetracycline resistance protein-like MFS transporter
VDRSLVVVLATVMINMMGVGMVWPILPDMVGQLAGGDVSRIAVLYGATAVAYSLMQFLCAPAMGALSDRYGRRPVMLIALAALGLDNILIAFAPSMAWIFAGRLIGGALASTMSIAQACIADVTPPGRRAAGFGRIGAAFGVGFILGPLVGGVLGEMSLRLPFFVAAGLSFANLALGLAFLAETLPPERRSARPLFAANPLAAVAWFGRSRPLLALGLALFVANTAQRGLEAIWVLFTGVQYGWGAREAGMSLAVVGASFVIVQGFLVRRAVDRLGERRVVVGGFLLSAAMYVVLAFNSQGWIGMLGILPHVLGWGMAGPALQAVASRAAGPDEQGYLQGATTAILGLAAILGPALATSIFAAFTSAAAPVVFPGAWFLAGSAGLAAAALLGLALRQLPENRDTV